jgi:nucleotide-binding universal stress UspA family protein
MRRRRPQPRTPSSGVAATDAATPLPDEDLRPITVGVNGSTSGWDALDWAAAEASARGCGLQVVHAFRPAMPDEVFGMVPLDQWAPESYHVAERVLKEAVRRARAISPGLTIITALRVGGTTQSALREGRGGALTVLASSSRLPATSHGGPQHGDVISISRWHALGALIRGVAEGGKMAGARRRGRVSLVSVRLSTTGATGPSTGRLVVSLEGATDPEAVLAFAFRAADRRRIDLTVLHSCTRSSPASSQRRVHVEGAAVALGLDPSDDALRKCLRQFPGVRTRQRWLTGALETHVGVESNGAALLVLSSRSRRWVHKGLYGPAEQRILACTRVPVALVSTESPR